MKTLTLTIPDSPARSPTAKEEEEFKKFFRESVAPYVRGMKKKCTAWKIEARELLDFVADGEVTITQIEKYISQNPPSAGAIGVLAIVARERFKAEHEVNLAHGRKKGVETIKNNAKIVHDYIASLNDDLLKKPLPKVGLGLKTRANYIVEQLRKYGHIKSNKEPYKFAYVRKLLMQLDKKGQA
jgi:hypothetical protein